MYLKRLILNNFKNYSEASLDFCDKINCFVGDNGEGKTNLLDAIHYLSFCKSYFNPMDVQNIKHNEDYFAIHGHYSRNGDRMDQVSCIQRRNERKQFKLNSKEYERLADHIGLFPLVMISPYDRDLINEGSDVRRKYMDSVVSQFDKQYLEDLIAYNKILIQRNALLKTLAEKGSNNWNEMSVWDRQLVERATPIHLARQEFIEGFSVLFQEYFQIISDGKEHVEIQYESGLNEKSLEEMLLESRQKDLMLRYTTCGIHKDDLVLLINGFPAKRFGSQGQQKSFVVAMKLAQFDFTRERKGYRPVLLLDDVFDKLDEKRVGQLVHLVADQRFGQVFITDTQPARIHKIFAETELKHIVFQVQAGQAKAL